MTNSYGEGSVPDFPPHKKRNGALSTRDMEFRRDMEEMLYLSLDDLERRFNTIKAGYMGDTP